MANEVSSQPLLVVYALSLFFAISSSAVSTYQRIHTFVRIGIVFQWSAKAHRHIHESESTYIQTRNRLVWDFDSIQTVRHALRSELLLSFSLSPIQLFPSFSLTFSVNCERFDAWRWGQHRWPPTDSFNLILYQSSRCFLQTRQIVARRKAWKFPCVRFSDNIVRIQCARRAMSESTDTHKHIHIHVLLLYSRNERTIECRNVGMPVRVLRCGADAHANCESLPHFNWSDPCERYHSCLAVVRSVFGSCEGETKHEASWHSLSFTMPLCSNGPTAVSKHMFMWHCCCRRSVVVVVMCVYQRKNDNKPFRFGAHKMWRSSRHTCALLASGVGVVLVLRCGYSELYYEIYARTRHVCDTLCASVCSLSACRVSFWFVRCTSRGDGIGSFSFSFSLHLSRCNIILLIQRCFLAHVRVPIPTDTE